jgi:hypothetical protein
VILIFSVIKINNQESFPNIVYYEAVRRYLFAQISFDMAQASKRKKKKPWRDISREAQQYRDASIARVQPELPQLPENLPKNVTRIPGTLLACEEIKITGMLPEDLLGVLASGELTAVAVTTAFLRRAGLAQKLVCSHGFVVSWFRSCTKLRS